MRNKLLLFTSLLASGFAACTPTKDDYKKDFIKGCVNSYAKDSTVASVEGRNLVETYCNCMGDNLDAKMDVEGWRQFNKSGDTLMTKYLQDITPCKTMFSEKRLTLPKPE